MAQSEDTELRDLVIDALEKNGSLAKIRALLRANVFLAFDEDCENKQQNTNLDNTLSEPEGLLSWSIIHEFLEFCNLKNTLFVYVAESRQGKQFIYEGQKGLSDKFRSYISDSKQEPILVTLIKTILKSPIIYAESDNGQEGFKENRTYITHESSTTSTNTTSQSDTSSDEKNKLHLRLQLDNSDTDTSSESIRDRRKSEYIPNEHVLSKTQNQSQEALLHKSKEELPSQVDKTIDLYQTYDMKVNNTSSDSTSYVELKPPDSTLEKHLSLNIQTSHLSKEPVTTQPDTIKIVNEDTDKSNTSSAISSSLIKMSMQESDKQLNPSISLSEERHKSEVDYTPDFTSSKEKDLTLKSPNSIKEVIYNKNVLLESLHDGSQSSHSTISISDVADLILSELSEPPYRTQEKSPSESKKTESKKDTFRSSVDASGDFTDSPIPSLSNLSLEIHSD